MTNKTISALTAATTPLAGTEVVPLVQSGGTAKVAATEIAATLVQTNSSFGVGVALSTWTLGVKTEWGASGNFILANGAGNMSIGTGAYYNAGWKYVGNDYASRYQQTGGRHSWQSATLNASGPGTGAAMTERMALDTSFNLLLVQGNFVPSTAAKGINFTANTPAAGMTSQLLNWYEEGAWTTTVSGIANFTGTPTLSSGKYTRTGRKVTIEGKFSGTVTTASTLTYLQFTIPTSRSATTDGGSGSAMSSSGLKSGNVFNAGADITTAFLVIPSTSAQPSGADTFFFSYTYNA